MVDKIQKGDNTFYICEACDMAYKDGELAQKCEDWCNKYHSCNIEITKHAVKF